jgi:hypothetical protein
MMVRSGGGEPEHGADVVAAMPRAKELTLPGGWLLRRPIGSCCRGVEVMDPAGVRLAAVRADIRPTLTIEWAWRGLGEGHRALDRWAPDWWALAVGRADGSTPLNVTFTGRSVQRWRRDKAGAPVRTVVTPMVEDGLWVVTVPGLHFAVTCRQGTRAHVVRHIEPVPGGWRSASGKEVRR